MILTDLITEANETGWLINNLFQLSIHSWRANLRNDSFGTEFGEGPTPEAALDNAIERMAVRYPLIKNLAAPSIATPAQLISLADLLKLPKPAAPTIIRRI